MIEENKNLKPIQFIQDLCKDKPEKEILEAEDNFRAYLDVVKDICDRIEWDRKSVGFDEG